MSSIQEFIAAWELFADPAIAGAIGGGLLGWLGVFVVARQLIFLSAAASQCASLGVTAALAARLRWAWPASLCVPSVWAFVLTMLALVALTWGEKRSHTNGDVRLGVLYLGGAAGTLALASQAVEEMHDVNDLLFGTAVSVLPEARWALTILAAFLLSIQWFLRRGLADATFDPVGASVRGVPVRLMDLVTVGSIGLASAYCTQILGALPTFGLSLLPALAALECTRVFSRALYIALILGASSGLVGYFIAFAAELPVGASQCLVAGIVYACARVLRVITSRTFKLGDQS